MVIKVYPVELEAVENFTRIICWLRLYPLITGESEYEYWFYHLLAMWPQCHL